MWTGLPRRMISLITTSGRSHRNCFAIFVTRETIKLLYLSDCCWRKKGSEEGCWWNSKHLVPTISSPRPPRHHDINGLISSRTIRKPVYEYSTWPTTLDIFSSAGKSHFLLSWGHLFFLSPFCPEQASVNKDPFTEKLGRACSRRNLILKVVTNEDELRHTICFDQTGMLDYSLNQFDFLCFFTRRGPPGRMAYTCVAIRCEPDQG